MLFGLIVDCCLLPLYQSTNWLCTVAADPDLPAAEASCAPLAG
jgi:hypothetical protein